MRVHKACIVLLITGISVASYAEVIIQTTGMGPTGTTMIPQKQ
jgi:hypothetical protein